MTKLYLLSILALLFSQTIYASEEKQVFKITCHHHSKPFSRENCVMEKKNKLEAIKQEYLATVKEVYKDEMKLQEMLKQNEESWKKYAQYASDSVYQKHHKSKKGLMESRLAYNDLLKDRIANIWEIWGLWHLKAEPIIKIERD